LKKLALFSLSLLLICNWLGNPSLANAIEIGSQTGSWADVLYHSWGSPASPIQNGDGTITVNGYTFDPVAAAKALMLGMWNDVSFINMLKAYAIDHPNSYTNTEPQISMQLLMDFLNTVSEGAIKTAQDNMSPEDIEQKKN